jgi:hypothetical protein
MRSLEDDMQLKGITTVAIVTLLTVGCGYSIKTATDYDRTVNFSHYKTFFMLKGNSSGQSAARRASHR